MLQRFPSTVAVIDHFCRIGVDGDIREVDVEQLCALAKYPQLHIKLSAFYALGRATPPCKKKKKNCAGRSPVSSAAQFRSDLPSYPLSGLRGSCHECHTALLLLQMTTCCPSSRRCGML
eukprot:COSAG01_NODE_4770_length_4754_cov_5.256713_6_plen_119_part_00